MVLFEMNIRRLLAVLVMLIEIGKSLQCSMKRLASILSAATEE